MATIYKLGADSVNKDNSSVNNNRLLGPIIDFNDFEVEGFGRTEFVSH